MNTEHRTLSAMTLTKTLSCIRSNGTAISSKVELYQSLHRIFTELALLSNQLLLLAGVDIAGAD